MDIYRRRAGVGLFWFSPRSGRNGEISMRFGPVSVGFQQGFNFRPVRLNRRAPVPVYRSGLAGYRSEPVEFKFRRSTGSDRYTGRLDRFTGRFDW